MTDIYNASGDLIAEIPLSENQLLALEAGLTVTLQFHTPQLMRGGSHGNDTGSLSLRKEGDHIVTDDLEPVKRLHALVKRVAAAQTALDEEIAAAKRKKMNGKLI